jgi:hypothetical protein
MSEDQAHHPLDDVPGIELVRQGLRDLAQERITTAALLVAIGRPRLTFLGVDVPDAATAISHPELALYRKLVEDEEGDAFSLYNSLIRRLVSCERELERRVFRARRLGETPPRLL